MAAGRDRPHAQPARLGHELRQWSYEVGGRFLSRTAHDAGHGPLQDAIAAVVGEGRSGPLSSGDYETVRRHCSTLQSLLAADLASRRDSPL